jgi:histidine triad (HIT) family protein
VAETVFEKIISGKLPCAKVYEDEQVFAFMDAGQVNPGHVIVATKKPYETLLDADARSAAAMMVAAFHIAKAVDRIFQAEGITILQANRAAAWQSVPHLHLHVLPRHRGDGVDITWPKKNPELGVLQAYAVKIAAHL